MTTQKYKTMILLANCKISSISYNFYYLRFLTLAKMKTLFNNGILIVYSKYQLATLIADLNLLTEKNIARTGEQVRLKLK